MSKEIDLSPYGIGTDGSVEAAIDGDDLVFRCADAFAAERLVAPRLHYVLGLRYEVAKVRVLVEDYRLLEDELMSTAAATTSSSVQLRPEAL